MPVTCSACGIRGDGRKIMWVGRGSDRACGARNPADPLSLANCQVRVERARSHLARFASPPPAPPPPTPAPPPRPPPFRMVIPGPARIREQQMILETIAVSIAGRFQTTKTTVGKMMETLDDYKEQMPEQCYLELANQMKKVYDSSVRSNF